MIDREFHLKDHDLYLEAFKLAAQIPPGKVSTYGAIARALGDISASRAVGQIMSADRERPFKVPCHRSSIPTVARAGTPVWAKAPKGKGSCCARRAWIY